MKYRARNAKRDDNESDIVTDLKKCGALVFRLSQPCDLLVKFADRLYLMDVSNPENKYRKREAGQLAMFAEWGVLEVTCSDEALRAVGAM